MKKVWTVAWFLMVSGLLAANPQTGRFVWTSDGNDHDRDDILGDAVLLSIIAAKQAQRSVPVFIYADHIWETSDQEKDMRESIDQAIKLWGGFDGMRVYNAYQEELKNKGKANAAVQAMVREINKSSEADPLTIGTGGPNQIVVEALKAADPAKIPHVTVIGHGTGTFNDNHGKRHGGYTFDDLVATGVRVVKIANQNGDIKDGSGIPRFRCSFDEVSHWKDHANPCLRLLWERGQKGRKDDFDGSDAGIVWWYFMGHDENGNFQKLEQWIIESWKEPKQRLSPDVIEPD